MMKEPLQLGVLLLFLVVLPYLTSKHVRDLVKAGLPLEIKTAAGQISLCGICLFLVFGALLVCEPVWHGAVLSLQASAGGAAGSAGSQLMQESGRMLLRGALVFLFWDLVVVAWLDRGREQGRSGGQ
jgi:hypothetical protein